jgi:hypothetical protein
MINPRTLAGVVKLFAMRRWREWDVVSETTAFAVAA